jgi:hypothetical protein
MILAAAGFVGGLLLLRKGEQRRALLWTVGLVCAAGAAAKLLGR